MLDKMPNKTNRVLPNENMDDMFHALGRPASLAHEFYRNYYCTENNGPLAKAFQKSPNWKFSHSINNGRDATFEVSDGGIEALINYIERLDEGKTGGGP